MRSPISFWGYPYHTTCQTEEGGVCISLFDGRLRFAGYGPSHSGFECRIEPDDDFCVSPPTVTLNPPVVAPAPPVPPVIHVGIDCDSSKTFLVLVITPDSDVSSETAVDAVRELSADALAVDSPSEFESTRPDNWGTVCGGEFGEFGAQIYTTGDGVAGSAVDIGYIRVSSQRHVQANKVENGDAESAADIGYTRASSQRHAQTNLAVEQRE